MCQTISVSITAKNQKAQIVIESRSFGKKFQRSRKLLGLLPNFFITCKFIIIPQNPRPKTAAPFFLHRLPAMPRIQTIHNITGHHSIIYSSVFRPQFLQRAVYLAVAIYQGLFFKSQLARRTSDQQVCPCTKYPILNIHCHFVYYVMMRSYNIFPLYFLYFFATLLSTGIKRTAAPPRGFNLNVIVCEASTNI